MIIFCLSMGLIVFIVIRTILYFINLKYGKISYDGFYVAGFAYKSEDDLFYSTKNAWQKKFGYGYIYDIGAPIFRMIIDTEPIKFRYNNKNWLITFWKGQYGITTGAEIGIYSTNEVVIDKTTMYGPVNNDEMLDMSFKLYKKKEMIFEISSFHWWLAAFKLGMFSNPKDLLMDIKLTFPNSKMLEAFLASFKKAGYKKKDFKIEDNTLYFVYKKPHTRQVYTRTFLTDFFTQRKNRKNVELYNKLTDNIVETNGIDNSLIENEEQLIILNDLIPDIFKNEVDKAQLRFKNIVNKNIKNKVEGTKIIKKTNNSTYLRLNIYKIKQDHKECDKHHE